MQTTNVFFHNEGVSFALDSENRTAKWLISLVEMHSKEVGELSYIFCSDDYLLKLNREHLDHDYFTDIITFDYCENGVVSGDLFISLDRVRENAKTFGKTQMNELNRVIAHGLLHLLGFKDESADDIVEMRKMEEVSLDLLKNI